MAKNTWQIAQAKQMARMEQTISLNITSLYACLAFVLREQYRWDNESIEILFNLTADKWDESLGHMESMIDWVEKETGINVRCDRLVGKNNGGK